MEFNKKDNKNIIDNKISFICEIDITYMNSIRLGYLVIPVFNYRSWT